MGMDSLGTDEQLQSKDRADEITINSVFYIHGFEYLSFDFLPLRAILSLLIYHKTFLFRKVVSTNIDR